MGHIPRAALIAAAQAGTAAVATKANGLATTGTTVAINSTAPSASGKTLVTTSATVATWQSPTATAATVARGVAQTTGVDATVDGGPAGEGGPGVAEVGRNSSAVAFYNNIGFFGTTPTTQQAGGQNVTNNVTDSGSTNGTVPNWTDLSTYANDATNIRRALYQIARMLKQDHDALRAYGLLT